MYLINADGTGERQLTNNPAYDTGAEFSPDGRKIVFSGAYTTSADTPPTESIFTINVDGSGQKRLTTDRLYSFAESPTFSPDGRYIVYTTLQQGLLTLVVVNSDGGGERRLTQGDGAAFSPDSRTIVFASPIEGSRSKNISTINFDGSGEKLLTNTVEINERVPVFSPDGRRIAFVSNSTGNPAQIYVINADGTGQVSLTSSKGASDGNFFPNWR